MVGLAKGPDWLVILGQIGAAGGLLVFLVALPPRSPFGYPWVALFGLVLNMSVIFLGRGLDLLFIHPARLPRTPSLTADYEDPSKAFRLKVPADWTVEPNTRGTMGTSISLNPGLAEKTAGVAQIDIAVQPLEHSGGSAATALDQLVKWVKAVTNAKGKKEGEISVVPERITLPDGNPGLHLKLKAWEWWIPVEEDVLYGVRPGRFLCMINCSGLAAYSSLYKPLCLRLYATIQTPD